MKKILIFLIFFSLILVVDAYTLNGTIQNELELPLQNARLDFNGTHKFTDINGYYNFTNINEGNYTVLARAIIEINDGKIISYNNNSKNIEIKSNTTLNFTLREKQVSTMKSPGFDVVGLILMIIVGKKYGS